MTITRSSTRTRSHARTAFGISTFAIFLLTPLFQNCSSQNFSALDSDVLAASAENPVGIDSITDPKYSNFALIDQIVFVEMNQPKQFEGKWTGEKGSLNLSTADNSIQSVIRTVHGEVRIQNGKDFQVLYTPDHLFRGEDSVRLFAVDDSGKGGKAFATVTFQVGNRLNFLKPALALRGPSCTSCHAQVVSNFITDFGYGDYYLETQRPAPVADPSYGFYMDHSVYTGANGDGAGSMTYMNLAPTTQVFVPKADLVGYLKVNSGETTLAGYLRNRFALSPNAGTRAASNNVREVKKLFIGAPSTARLLSVFETTAIPGAIKYLQDDSAHPVALSPLPVASGGKFILTGDVSCDGDLLLQGTVHLNDVRILSQKGCRIYATGSIFVSQGLTSMGLAGSMDHNIQLVSSRAVIMGLGPTMNAAGTTTCESTGWYRDRWVAGPRDALATSSLQNHLNARENTSYTRAYGAEAGADAFLASVIAESTGLAMKDATCETGGRGRAFSRLLIVAPRVDSRYNGNFSGSIVAEASIISVGSFKFSFDPIFERAAILPLLSDADFLSIEE